MSDFPVDMVTSFLASSGIATEVVYLGCSDVVIGRRARLPELEFVYRQEGTELIICYLAVGEPIRGGRGAVAAFIRLIRTLIAVAPLSRVRGLLLDSASRQSLNAVRGRLVHVFEEIGARWQDIDGDRWLVYVPPSAAAGRRERALG